MRRAGRKAQAQDPSGFGTQFVPLAQAAAAGARQIVLVPGAAVPMLALDLPARLRGLAREQVARRQLQDRFGLSADDVEMRPFQKGGQADWDSVLVADTALVRSWRDKVTQSRGVMLPDYLALPTTDGLWTVHRSDTGAAVRLGPGDGFGGQAEIALLDLADRIADQGLAPKAILMLGQAWPELEAQAKDHDIPVLKDVDAVAQIDGLDLPRVLEHGETACNLCRDPALVRDRLRNQLMPWRWPVAVLAIALTLWIASDVLEIQRLRDERIAIQQATESIVRDVFVPQGPILDIRSQVTQAQNAMLSGAGDDVGPLGALALFEQVGRTLFDARARMLRVSSPDGARLDLVLETEDFAAADAVTKALAATGLDVRVVGSRRTGDGSAIRSEIQLLSTGDGGQP